MLVMDVIAEILKREGISTLFCFPTTPIIEAAAAVGHQAGHLPAGAGRRPYGRRVRSRLQWPPAGRVRDAIRAGRGERLRRRRDGLFGFEPGGVSAARSPARDGATVPDVQIEPLLCRDHQIGRRSDPARADRERHAARLCAGEERPAGPGHGGSAGRCPQHRRECRSERVPAGSDHPVGRRRARHRRGGAHAARRLLPDDPRRAGRLLCRGHRGIAAAGRAAAGAGHDDLRRQERLSGGPRIGARARRRHLYRARPAFPAQIGSGAGRRLQLYQAWHRHPRHCRPARRSSTRPTTRATCTRLSPPISGFSATPSSCSAN